MTRTIVRTVTVALVLGALAAPTAIARPADTPPPVADTTAAAQDKQDLRSADAIDAATLQKQDMRSADAIDAATRPAPGSQATPRSDAPAQAADSGVAWMTSASASPVACWAWGPWPSSPAADTVAAAPASRRSLPARGVGAAGTPGCGHTDPCPSTWSSTRERRSYDLRSPAGVLASHATCARAGSAALRDLQ